MRSTLRTDDGHVHWWHDDRWCCCWCGFLLLIFSVPKFFRIAIDANCFDSIFCAPQQHCATYVKLYAVTFVCADYCNGFLVAAFYCFFSSFNARRYPSLSLDCCPFGFVFIHNSRFGFWCCLDFIICSLFCCATSRGRSLFSQQNFYLLWFTLSMRVFHSSPSVSVSSMKDAQNAN